MSNFIITLITTVHHLNMFGLFVSRQICKYITLQVVQMIASGIYIQYRSIGSRASWCGASHNCLGLWPRQLFGLDITRPKGLVPVQEILSRGHGKEAVSPPDLVRATQPPGGLGVAHAPPRPPGGCVARTRSGGSTASLPFRGTISRTTPLTSAPY